MEVAIRLGSSIVLEEERLSSEERSRHIEAIKKHGHWLAAVSAAVSWLAGALASNKAVADAMARAIVTIRRCHIIAHQISSRALADSISGEVIASESSLC